MAIPSTQDFVKGIDLTFLETLSASQVEQLVQAGYPYSDKGLILSTTDEYGEPIVPNPEGNYSGVTPSKWKQYLWKRSVYDGTVKIYSWNESAESDATLLKWEDIQTDATEALSIANAASTTASDAMAAANEASSTANSANTTAIAAQATANSAKETATNTQTNVNNQLTAFGKSTVPTGTPLPTLSSKQYSKTVDEGWLLLDGSNVSKVTFKTLYDTIGGTVVGDQFTLPDWRGKTARGKEDSQTLGQAVGSDTVTLTVDNVPLPPHQHDIPVEASDITADAAQTGKFKVDGSDDIQFESASTSTKIGRTQMTATPDEPDPIAIIPSGFAVNWIIKT